VSDGVTAGTDDTWLLRLIAENRGAPSDLARAILDEAEHRFGCDDDMTAIVINIDERK